MINLLKLISTCSKQSCFYKFKKKQKKNKEYDDEYLAYVSTGDKFCKTSYSQIFLFMLENIFRIWVLYLTLANRF